MRVSSGSCRRLTFCSCDAGRGGCGGRSPPWRGAPPVLIVLALVLGLVSAGCSRPVPGIPPPVPPPDLDPLGSVDLARWDEDEWVIPEDYEPAFRRDHLFRPDAEAALLDGILDSPWADEPEMRERVAYWESFWQTRGAEHFAVYLERMGRYQALVDEKIRERYMPPSLRYLPLVESGYQPTVSSRAGANGLWQLMRPTARSMGLRVDVLVDQRRDPIAATPIALDYLGYLRERFNSWFLALAAYNGGPGRLSRLLDRYAPDEELGDHLFWKLRPHLPRETQDFVPKFLAAARIARSPQSFGFAEVEVEQPVPFAEVEIEGGFPLDVLARASGVPPESVRQMNPQFLRDLTPPGSQSSLRLPPNAVEVFLENYPRIPPEERVAFFQHRVEKGETLSHIARRYGIRVADLQAANPGLNPRRLQIGQRLAVITGPASGDRRSRSAAAAPPSSSVREEASSEARGGSSSRSLAPGLDPRAAGTVPDSPGGRHVVVSGESLWSIARLHGVSVDDLRAWNGIGEGSLLHPGEILVVEGEGARVYEVRAGDTLSEIAARHGVRVADLIRWNGLSPSSVIHPGDRVRILSPGR